MPLFLEACPSFQAAWQASPQQLLYVGLGDFARHLLQLQQQNRTEEFGAVSQVIERLHVEGDHYVREAATTALFEAIQDVWSSNQVDPELFSACLLPESARRWRSLKDFWGGKSKRPGEEA
jgi:hypothetical protein